MRLYQIPLPVRHNDGTEALPARSRFLASLVRICGGYTLAPEARGTWRDPKTQKVYFDTVTPVQFACDNVASKCSRKPPQRHQWKLTGARSTMAPRWALPSRTFWTGAWHHGSAPISAHNTQRRKRSAVRWEISS